MAEQAPSPPPSENPPSATPLSADTSADPLDALNVESAGEVDRAAIEEILRQASFEDVPQSAASPNQGSATITSPAETAATAADEIHLPNFQQVIQDAQVSSIDLLRDVDLNVRIELGRSRMMVEDVLKLGEGSVVELDKLAGDPVDVFVNERLVARGEVLVLNDNFCVRINEIVAAVKEESL